MATEEIVKLSREAILELLRSRRLPVDEFDGPERRRQSRWPFPSAAELRPDGGDGSVQWFGTCENLSQGGLGVTCDHVFEPGTTLEISFHLPEASFYGRAVVRHCHETPRGQYVGVEFLWDD